MPTSLNSLAQRRQYLMALMFVSGISQREIAARLGYSIGHVRNVVASPMFREFAAEVQRELHESTLGSLVDRIEREAMPSLDVLVDLRDGNFEDPKVAAVQAGAAKFILGDLHMDRKQPKVTKQENDGVLHVTFGPDALRQMLGAQAEATGEVIDVEFEQGNRTTLALPAPAHRTDLNDRDPDSRVPVKKVVKKVRAQPINELLDELEDDEDTARQATFGSEY